MSTSAPHQWQKLLSAQPRALGTVSSSAILRKSPADFRVEEVPGFEFTGEGDHLCLQLEKTALNSMDVVQRLVQVLKVKPVDIGFFGLKDRNATTTQWFTVHLPGKEARPLSLETGSQALGASVRILTSTRHHRKIKTGSHKSNRFRITLHGFVGDAAEFERRAEQLFNAGFPNYFGEQRFGLGARNLEKALTLFRNKNARRQRVSRHQRGLYLSSARSFLFNHVLAERIRAGDWLTAAADEWLVLDGSRSYFKHSGDAVDAERLLQKDIHTSGPLWGRGDTINPSERVLIEPYNELALGLEHEGMNVARRALRATVNHAALEFNNKDTVTLSFELAAGSYATAVLRELCDFSSA